MYMLDLSLFARGGGGGSGGGGGGGGGGLIAVGYLPMHFIGAWLRKHLDAMLANLIAWPICLVFSVFLVAVFRGFGVVMAGGAIAGTGAGLYGWFNKLAKLRKKAKIDMQAAALGDSSWNEADLTENARKTFMQYQYDWSMNDVSKVTYMTPWYQFHAKLMITALQQIGRQDYVYNPAISDITITKIDDTTGKDGDAYEVAITAKADDQLYDMTQNKLLFRDTSEFIEFWRFERSNNQWLLAQIRQATENPLAYNQPLADFARERQYCYSPDWGWLLLPQRGQLFGKANFGNSDINNHVIGVYHNTLIQLYNYIPYKAKENYANYLIAQVTVPKTYGNIVVRHKKWGRFGISGLTKVKMEWGDFNKEFEVFASDLERVTSFELLHPAYMEKLHDLPFEVNIEVVDNVVYLYTAKMKASSENYEVLLSILYEAFKQMRM